MYSLGINNIILPLNTEFKNIVLPTIEKKLDEKTIQSISTLIDNFKLSYLTHFIPQNDINRYYRSLQSINDTKFDRSVFIKKLIIANYTIIDKKIGFEDLVIHIINKHMKNYNVIKEDLIHLFEKEEFVGYVEYIHYINEIVDMITGNCITPSMEGLYALCDNLHLLCKDTRYDIPTILMFINKHIHRLPSKSIVYKSSSHKEIIDIVSDEKFTINRLIDILILSDRWCGVYCNAFDVILTNNDSNLEDSKSHTHMFTKHHLNLFLQRLNLHLLIYKTSGLKHINDYIHEMLKDINHLCIYHNYMSTEDYNSIVSKLDVEDVYKECIQTAMLNMSKEDVKYLLDIPYNIKTNIEECLSTIDRVVCVYSNKETSNIFNEISSLKRYLNMDVETKTTEETKTLKKYSDIYYNRYLDNYSKNYKIDYTLIEKYNSSSSGNIDKQQCNPDNIPYTYITSRTSRIKDLLEIFETKQKIFDIQHSLDGSKIVNDVDTLYNNIKEWDVDTLVMEYTDKNNIHVFTPPEYEQLLEKGINFYNRSKLSSKTIDIIKQKMIIYGDIKLPRINVLKELQEYFMCDKKTDDVKSSDVKSDSSGKLENTLQWFTSAYENSIKRLYMEDNRMRYTASNQQFVSVYNRLLNTFVIDNINDIYNMD